MLVLRAYLFQSFKVTTKDGDLLDLGSPTGRSLFAYLLVQRRQPNDRRRLAFIFWPRASETAARRNLRQYLHRIRRALEPVDPQGDLLLSDGSLVQINPKAEIWLDVDAFRRGCQPESGLGAMQEAAALYCGDLLEDIYEDWPQEERQTLRQQYLNLLARLSLELQEAGQAGEALIYAQKWTAAEPLDEAAHRRLMALFALNGERSRALQVYQSLQESLARELQTEPLPETQALAGAIQSGSLGPATRPPGNGSTYPLHSNGARLSFRIPVHGGVSPALGQDSSPFPAHQELLPLVGRDAELSHLDHLLHSQGEGRNRFFLISGESGVGKTRLVQEYLDRHPDLISLQAVCHELESMVPYAPLRQLVSQVIEAYQGLSSSPPPAWLEELQNFLPAMGQGPARVKSPGAEPAEIHQPGELMRLLLLALSDLAAGQSSELPVHLVVDDLHWSDTPTWDFLGSLARQAARMSLVMVGLCRLEDLPPERGRLMRALERNGLLAHLPLKRLSPAETAELARQIFPEQQPDALFLNRLYQETEGNPFFIIEIVRAASEAGRAPSLPLDSGAQRSASPGLPLSIQRVIEARLDHLSPASQELLATAAVMGSTFTFSLLEAASQAPVEEIVGCIEEWCQRGLVREDAFGYDFSHEKIRQVAYASLSRARRQYLHRRIAGVLESAVPAADAATLALHYARSDQPLRALPFLTQAGEQALWVRSYQEARQLGLQAVNLLGRTPGPRQSSERIDLNLQLAQAYAFSGDLARAQEILSESEHLAAALGDEARQGQIFHRSAQIFWLRGQPALAGDYARRTLRAAEELEDRLLLLAALRMLGRVGIAISTFDDAIAYLLRYNNLSEEANQPPDLPIVLGYLGVAYARVGSWSRAQEAAQRGLALAQAGGSAPGAATAVAFARMQLAFVYADHGDWEACARLVEDALGFQDAPGGGQTLDAPLTPLGFMLLSLRGRVLAQRGHPEQAIQTIRSALEWAERSDYRVFHYLPRLFLGESLLLANQPEAALVEAEIALEQARAAGNRWASAVTLRLMADILIRLPAPNWPQVENYLIESMQLLRQVRARPDLARTYLALRRLYDRAGQIAWAVDCHFRATSIFEELGMSEELRRAQGQAAGERRGAVVIPGLALRGPNQPAEAGLS